MKVSKPKMAVWGFLFAVVVLGWMYFDDLGLREIPLPVLQQKYEKPESKYIAIEGTVVHYCDQGQGPTLLLLHGIADALQTWDAWVAALDGQYRMVRPDLPGFGLTGPAQGGDYSRENYIRFLDQFITRLKLSKVILVGNSLGGAIAWNYALEFPEKVQSMVLIDPAGYPLAIPYPLKMAGMPVIKHFAALVTPRFLFELSLRQVLGDSRKMTPEMVDRFYELNLRPGNRAALTAIMDNLQQLNADPAFSKAIAGIRTPTLLLWGEKDRWIPASQVQLWQRDLPGIQTIVYKGVGHVPQMEIPARSAADVHNWLTGPGSEEKQTPVQIVFQIMLVGCGVFIAALLSRHQLKKKRNPRIN